MNMRTTITIEIIAETTGDTAITKH